MSTNHIPECFLFGVVLKRFPYFSYFLLYTCDFVIQKQIPKFPQEVEAQEDDQEEAEDETEMIHTDDEDNEEPPLENVSLD